MFVGLASAYANRPGQAPGAPSPYALQALTTSGQTGLTPGAGLGIRTDRPAGLGIR